MILLTRKKSDSKDLAQKLKAKCLIEPMLSVVPVQYKLPKNIQAIITTSRNAKLPRNAKHIITIPKNGENASEILKYASKNLSKNKGEVIYLSGDEITLDIAAELKKKGFKARRVIAYKTIYAKDFSKRFYQRFKHITHAAFYSSNTLTNFLKLLRQNKLSARNITLVAFSKKIAAETKKTDWKQIVICPKPDAQEMIALLNNLK